MKTRSGKTTAFTISVPTYLLNEIDKAAKVKGQTRSAWFARLARHSVTRLKAI